MKIERLLYFGTAPIAVPALQALHQDPHSRVMAVCTQPDRPKGRKRVMTPSPVKACALELGIQVVDAETIGDAESQLADLKPDLALVFAYGQYLPSRIFDLPRMGSINFHPSLLPAYRGASPIQTALADGRQETGLSVIRVGKQMDAGDIQMQETVSIAEEDTAETLSDRFAHMAGEWVPELLRQFREEEVVWTPQNEDLATECGRLTKEDGDLDWSLPAQVICNRIRAYQPWPGMSFQDEQKRIIKIQQAAVVSMSGEPGTVLSTEGKGPVVACGEAALQLVRLQPPGKKPMEGAAFLRGNAWTTGMCLPVTLERA